MPKREDIKKVLVIGSGPIIIGQAAEFDYAGTQACLALKEEGYEVVLINSNPATIMTDTNMADKVYMEPLTLEYVARIIRMERPDAIVPGLGGQTGLNLVMQLHNKGILEECQVEILGTSIESIQKAEDRECFKEMCVSINEPVIASKIANNLEEGILAAEEIGYPLVLRPAFTLGGTGGGFVDTKEEFIELMKHALSLSPTHQVLVEKSIKGYQEIEFEVMRDKTNKAIAICDMENMDPVGIHTGDSIVFAPCLTLSSKQYTILKQSALKIIQELKIEGGCNVQFALEPNTSNYFLIEVNPRVSRSSALASKATAYPIARVTAKIAVGYTLDEIDISGIAASLEPAIDYIVCKVARFPFDKFQHASNTLSTQMKATGEVMSLGVTVEEALLKALRGLEVGSPYPVSNKFITMSKEELLSYIVIPTDDRIFALFEALRKGANTKEIAEATKITEFFIQKIENIVTFEKKLQASKNNLDLLQEAKQFSIADSYIGSCWGLSDIEVYQLRKKNQIYPNYRIVDNFKHKQNYVPYFYSTYSSSDENHVTDNKKVIVLGSGPIRIGQGVEFDYSTVHAIWAIKELGYEAIIINNNPETLSTDFTIADKLYFEPLILEDVMNVIDREKPIGVIVTLGGQTAVNLAEKLTACHVQILGSDLEAIEKAENRDAFEKVMNQLQIPQPNGKAVHTIEDGLKIANMIGYPVLVRPSYVLGGRAMQIVNDDNQLKTYLLTAVQVDEKQPVLVDKYIVGKELEVDAICDGVDVFIPGIMEHVEETGVHSGDSISVYPTMSISNKTKELITYYTNKLGLGLGIKGLFNIQFIVDENENVYVIEVNPRSSRTVPFLSKVTAIPVSNIATKVMLGQSLKSQGYGTFTQPIGHRWYVKVPTFSFAKIVGLDAVLSPEMKSTGEVIGYDDNMNRALYKALQASGSTVCNYGTVFVTISDSTKYAALPLIKRFYKLGFNIEATYGTAEFLKRNGIKTRIRQKISDGSNEIIDSLRGGHITYVVNTVSSESNHSQCDGAIIRRTAVENGITMFTSLSTVNVLLNVLEEITVGVHPIK
ncbi:carbamoyl-phosphate synthase large subunit [Anaerorhabdus furcosa]|uniref:Carbamoyl-phosphate synthase large subunit n=1 Tax=Anaerorhabdus furcosa TaxID=118967 RepID=A0A1T4KBN6_9FIRM|nr:carbamoyl-phosphate synthase large subunit [Anaerorhabdus furcosa]SJZ39854.1 carbamoyl-phosphate synthase large subunit [Anaerorhabdus furcosa]